MDHFQISILMNAINDVVLICFSTVCGPSHLTCGFGFLSLYVHCKIRLDFKVQTWSHQHILYQVFIWSLATSICYLKQLKFSSKKLLTAGVSFTSLKHFDIELSLLDDYQTAYAGSTRCLFNLVFLIP